MDVHVDEPGGQVGPPAVDTSGGVSALIWRVHAGDQRAHDAHVGGPQLTGADVDNGAAG